MKKNKIIIVATILLLGFTTFSCKKYLDVNKNPNEPQTVTIDLALPGAQANIANALGFNFAVFGGMWAQYWTQSPNSSEYRTVDSYTPAATDMDNSWSMLYSGALQNLKFVETQAAAQQKYNYSGIAKLLEAYTYQVLTDNFGDIPFSEALKINDGITSPKYDKQEAIYDGIIALAKDGLADINKNSILTPGSDDLIYNGNMDLWKAFGNTLLLKMYLRLSDINSSKAQAGIAALTPSTFISDGQTAKIKFTTVGGNQNPFYAAAAGSILNKTQNLYASSTIIDTMNYYTGGNSYDPRLDAFYYTPGASYAGIQQGAYSISTTPGKAFPSAFVGANSSDAASATAPVIFMSDYESYFLQAEAMARGWLSGSAATAYAGGVQASFNYCNSYTVSTYAEEIDTLAPYYIFSVPFPVSGLSVQLKAIALQKWIAMCGNQNCEAWIEQRRFDYPNLPLSKAANGITGGKLPSRFPYPDIEVTRNRYFPGQPAITQKVWWDTK